MNPPMLYRDRLIPRESILLKDDKILEYDENYIITQWKALKPKSTLARGYSCYLPKIGCKISRFYGHDQQFKYWYIDIVQSSYSEESNSWHFLDLLVDIIIRPDGFVEVLDLNELEEAYQKQLLDLSQLLLAIRQLDRLLKLIYKGEFPVLVQEFIEVTNREDAALNTQEL